jgi:hypothetical protein
MPQPQPLTPAPGRDPDLQYVAGERSLPRAGAPRPARALMLIVLLGGAVLAYLCFLVRISTVDANCLQRETEREKLRTVIATDLTELSVLSDTATNMDHAEQSGLGPAAARDQVPVSQDLCRPATPSVEGGPAAPARDTPALAAGMGTY